MTTQLRRRPASAPTPDNEPIHGWGWGRWVWRSLTSMRTAVILLALLAVAAIPGSVLPQRNVASDPAGVLNFAAENPDIYPWLDRLGMFGVYASPWFAAIYLLLLVSMTGCVLPRCARLWRAARSAPAPAPRNLTRMEGYQSIPVAESGTVADGNSGPTGQLEEAAQLLRRRGFRVESGENEVRAERGYLREVGNLVFHVSLLVLFVGVAAGRLFGFEGRVALAEGETFTNVSSAYDEFTPSVWTDIQGLEPFSFTLDEFEAGFAEKGPKLGEPRFFNAALSYRTATKDQPRRLDVRPNHPLDVNGTKAFLTGHGYAPVVTVRDGQSAVAYSGPVIFLPNDGSYASDGVVKAPDALPTQLGFEGFFLPTAAVGPQGPYSAFPDALNPQLFLTAFAGDLGMDGGEPQSVYKLDKSRMQQVQMGDGRPLARALSVGETMKLPNGQGSLTFDRVGRFANFQIAYDPGKEISLAAGVMLLLGLTTSLSIRRRRIWVRAIPDPLETTGSFTFEVAGQSMTRWPLSDRDIAHLVEALTARATAPPPQEGTNV